MDDLVTRHCKQMPANCSSFEQNFTVFVDFTVKFGAKMSTVLPLLATFTYYRNQANSQNIGRFQRHLSGCCCQQNLLKDTNTNASISQSVNKAIVGLKLRPGLVLPLRWTG